MQNVLQDVAYQVLGETPQETLTYYPDGYQIPDLLFRALD